MNRVSLRIVLLVVMAACWPLTPEPAHAATANVTCTTTVTPVNFGTVSSTNPATFMATGTVQFTCTNVSVLAVQDVTLCLGLGQGSGSSIVPTRQMNTTPLGNPLQFQLYRDAAATQVWGNVPSTSNPSPMILQFSIPLSAVGIPNTYTSPPYSVYGRLTMPQAGLTGASYANLLNGSLTYQANSRLLFPNHPSTCNSGATVGFTLPAQATLPKQCTVSAGSTLTLGNAAGVPAGTTNNTGSTTFNVTCTPGTIYNVGLAPLSTGSTNGAGLMAGTGSNTDKAPYQLSRTSPTGPVWGNTATASSVGNGVTGNGTGAAQTLTVYATAPGSNFRPDTYSDTVTINVNY